MFPEFQRYPHTNWDDEIKHIEIQFKDGSAYVVGKTNGDHWYCFVWGTGRAKRIHENLESKDYTLEILMTNLHPEIQGLFTKKEGLTNEGKSKITISLNSLYDNIQIDDYMFEPCGYSCNGIVDQGTNYFTVHVTPESHCSYASFETNIPPTEKHSHRDLLLKVLKIFRPSNFTITLFAEKVNFDEDVIHRLPASKEIGNQIEGYKRKDRINYEFENYDLAFIHYSF